VANPNTFQGTLNKLVASITWDDFPSLNITPSFLGTEGIDMTLDGPMTTMLPTMTGMVTSPEPYQQMRLVIHLIRAQPLAASYKAQWEASTLIGGGTIRPDVISSVLPPFLVGNVALTGVNTLNFSGRDSGFIVTCVGAYNLNATLWN
jgi:hypothetical protein